MSTIGLSEERDPEWDRHTDEPDLSALSRSGITRTQPTPAKPLTAVDLEGRLEAYVILIAHPEGRMLGSRFSILPNEGLEIGRSEGVGISLPDVLSVSRRHARLEYREGQVMLEDLGSTNGTFVNGHRVHDGVMLKSGDRFQVGGAHFKFLHELDVEHAYYEAIYDLVTRDGLTDVHNRRKYEEDVARELARARRHERPLSLVLVDLDDFKVINDRCGHLCGDFVLKRFAVVIGEILRPEQTFARMGATSSPSCRPRPASTARASWRSGSGGGWRPSTTATAAIRCRSPARSASRPSTGRWRAPTTCSWSPTGPCTGRSRRAAIG